MSLQTPAWLNAEFMQKVLTNLEGDDSIRVESVTTTAATAIGDNYMSDIIRVSVEYSCDKSDREKKSLLVKIAPTLEGSNRELVKEFGVFDTEIQMMKNTLVQMSDILNEKDYRLGARVLYAETTDPPFLVIDDLAPMGYRMADRQAGLDLQHCIIALRGLAKFHASSVAVCEQEPQQKLSYTWNVFREDNPETVKKFCVDGMTILSAEVATWPELESRANEYSDKLLKLSEVCYARATECAKLKNDEFNVINHGDFWVNNMLFRYDEEGNVTDHIFVDFQACQWNSPAIDILYFLSTSAPYDVYEHHREALIEEYLNILTDVMLRIGCKTKPPTMACLQKSLKDHEFLEFMSSYLTLPFALIDKSETKKLDDILKESGGYHNPAYKGQTYRKMMVRRLNAWNSRGLLDV